MLTRLKIKNIALIDESIIEFREGFNVLTGETGAGKSLIIDSLNFVLGARADRTLIKHGEDFAFVECLFNLTNISSDIESFFASINLEPESTIIISRYLNQNGKSEIKVNGEVVTNNMLKKLTVNLVEMHGQHAHQTLLDTKNHIQLLDGFSKEIQALKENLSLLLNELSGINKNISDLGGDGAERLRNIELLKYQISEIENANLKEDEEELLQQEKAKMLNSEKIAASLTSVSTSLASEDVDVSAAVKFAANTLKTISQFDDDFGLMSDRLSSAYFELQDVFETISDKLAGMDFSESRLTEVVERLDLIKDLKKKYGNSVLSIIEYLNQTQQKLESLENSDAQLEKLNTQKFKLLNQLYSEVVKLTDKRKSVAKEIEQKVVLQLKDLGMKNTKFEIGFENDYTLENIENKTTHNGADNVEFLFSANLGEPVKSLSKIISGGEMSRFMLAIKCVLNENDNKTFIFDEIDNGIGGEAGLIVAKKLSMISSINQVLCVTHLAQIASYGDAHFKIHKFESENKTFTQTNLVDGEDRVAELARLLGSVAGSEIGLIHARELLSNSGK